MSRKSATAVPRGPYSAYVLVGLATVTVLGTASVLTPPRMLTFGMLALGPALAAASANPGAVLAVGGYAFAAAFAISTWHGLLGTADQILRLLVVALMTVIAAAIARHLRRLLRADADAARQRETLAAIVEQSADAIIVTSLDGVVTHWNAGAQRLYGYRADEIVGTRFDRMLPAERLPVLEQSLATLAAGEPVRLDEARRIGSDGSEFFVSVAVTPIRDAAGVVVAAASTERDVTEHKRREAEERRALERSARAARLESLGQLAGGVAHDFNNLLAIILNYADFLAGQLTADGAEDLARLRDAAERARSLTRQLLLFAKQEPALVEDVDLNAVVASSGALLARTIGANISLVCRTHPGALPVRAHRGRLDQILLNLVINARDAMPAGGTVTLCTDRPQRCLARLTVTDTGCGMTAEVRERLFEPFFTTKPADVGTGLGLATVYGVVDEAGGQITVESAPGAGTTFEILLPLAGV